MKRVWLLALVPVVLIGAVVALFVGVYIVRPRFILSDFSSFLARHPVGSAVKTVGEDPFVDRATLAVLDDKMMDHQPGGIRREMVQKALAEHDSGKLDIMWTHTPPFGRVSAIFTYEAGRVVKVDTHDLD